MTSAAAGSPENTPEKPLWWLGRNRTAKKKRKVRKNKVGKKSILNNKEIAKLTEIPPPSAVASPENKEETEKGGREERKGDGF